MCGTRERYEHTNECVGCYHYREAIRLGNIHGIDGRKLPASEKQKIRAEQDAIAFNEHSENIKRGKRHEA